MASQVLAFFVGDVRAHVAVKLFAETADELTRI